MSRNYGALRESDKAIKFIERIQATEKPFAFDIEAGYVGDDKVGVSLQQFHPDYVCCGISFTIAPEWGRYIPFSHDAGGNVDDLQAVARALWRMLRTGRGIAHNAAYELKGMSRWFRETLWDDPEVGAEVRATGGMYPILADTMLLVWLAAEYDPIKVGKDLKSIADAAFGLKMCKFAELFPTEDSDFGPTMKRGKIRFARFNTRNAYNPTVISYACEDSVASLLIFDKYYEVMKDQAIFQIEMALIPELVRMEAGPIDETGKATGNMMFNWPVIRKKSAEAIRFGELMGEEILSNLSARLGRVININLNSVKQLSGVLFDERPDGLGLPVKIRSEKTNAPSTSDDALKVIAKSDPIIKRILEYRQVVKLNGSYLTKFIEELGYSGTGYVFPNHNQMGALTGRMSVDQVSYQQWPKPYHFELGSGLTFDFNFRDLFIAPSGFRIVGFDYANVEMRIAGALSGERKIIDAFNHGQDLHKATAAATFKVPFDAVTKKQRQAAKTLNFAILYGSGAGNIAEMLTSPDEPVTKEDAQALLDDYLLGYPDLARWIASQKAHGREEKVVHTHFRRKFTLWDHYSTKDWIRSKGDRMSVNAPIQGTAADIIKLAMVRVAAAIRKAGLQDKIRMTLTVHDALEFLVHESITTQEVIDLLDPCVNFPIAGFPLEIRADWHEGYQWGAVAEIELDQAKQIQGYVMEYELPWTREAFKWSGDTLHEALDPYYTWEAGHFGISANYYATCNPDFVIPTTVETVVPVFQEPVAEREVFLPDAFYAAHQPVKTITVSVREMPTEAQWLEFITFLTSNKGSDIVQFESPEGTITLDGRYALTEDQQPQVSLVLGGATLSFSSGDVDADQVMAEVMV